MSKSSLILSFMFSLNVLGQLKVDSYGRIIIGSTLTNLTESTLIYGNTKLVSSINNGANFTYFKINNGAPGLDIGTNGQGVAFYLDGNYKKLYASKLYKLSDSILKFNHFEIQNPIEKLQTLQPYLYNLYSIDENQVVSMNSEYGFFSQDVESALPEVNITENMHDYKLLDYNQIIPLIVAAMKDQQLQIDSLQTIIINCCQNTNLSIQKSQTSSKLQKSIITNLLPNPNSGFFTVEYFLKSEFKNVAFEINDSGGKQLSYLKLNSNEIVNRRLEINISSFDPGLYFITLITDGERSDSKKILKQ
jgi:hypothetical protein